jgi:hypothetical protein
MPRFIVQVFISLIFIGLAVWFLVGDYDPSLEKAAAGWLGLVLGFWLS